MEHSGSVLTSPCAQYEGGGEDPLFNERQGKELVELLQEHAKHLEDVLRDWECDIQVARTQFYQLNYYTTFQLLTLRREFSRYKASSSMYVPPNILALLHSVSPQIGESTDVVQDAVMRAISEVQSSPTNSNGDIHSALVSSKRSRVCDNRSSSNTSSYTCTNDSLDHSSTIDDLNSEQRQVFTRCVQSFGYSKSHVFKAFEECGPNANKYDIEQWCDNHDEDDYDQEEIKSDTRRSTSSMFQ